MPSHLYAVQDRNGRELVAAHVDVERVSDIQATVAHHDGQDYVQLVFEDVVVAEAPHTGQEGLTLLRWPSDEKLGHPVSHKVDTE